ncbi:SMP-30/gluconolactonase/LRE family protein [Profundibacterium mesophilum]|uniref:L-arabinonolactonase n=1 Tax=Profundibacterium mesophilum KAUST100406-0324 TaxID=1037889 RepID=A0A921NPN2_9RHOB|nr:SMP-30/gluconolactonase/LRE family protein [Profundibacterium mesophilum]KAF0674567.1 L-arabinonolactonase [Profundibacterium mesophilum KAUST100406-0324]
MRVKVHDARACDLGEGPLWHPGRQQLFWFDINACRLLTRMAGGARHWTFDGPVSAAGWIDDDTLIVAGDRALMRFAISDGETAPLCDLEADRPETRSNDGRADPHGGFWISTMGRRAEPGAGAIWRYHRGEMRRLFGDLTIPNAICFSADGRLAHFTDTARAVICRVPLGEDGWPTGPATDWLDLGPRGLRPDGAVIDAAGNLWSAQYGAGRLACYAPDGTEIRTVSLPAKQPTCPAFGGPDLSVLYCTSAAQDMEGGAPQGQGSTFAVTGAGTGRPEPRVIP